MNKKILFSPVGGTDPIAEDNMQDGSLLHICREYKPDQVYLYMSKEILEKHEKDNRYILCLQKLEELQGHTMEYELIRRPDLTAVYSFDYFYHEFHRIVADIAEKMDDSDILLLNVSSGTPAMKSGLLVLATLGEYQAKTIQVLTPEKRMNQHHHSEEYDLDFLWEYNEDNDPNHENRCVEVTCPTLSDMMKKEIIKKHILVYDYRAALDVADTIHSKNIERLKEYLAAAYARSLLNKKEVDDLAREGYDLKLPVMDSKYRDCFEYALLLQIKLARCEYADYIRAISPIIMDMYELVIERQCRLKVRKYYKKNHKSQYVWDKDSLAGTDLLNILDNAYNGRFEYYWPKSDHLSKIIASMVSDQRIKKLTDDLRSVEDNIRNLAAHEIVSITEETIKKKTGFTGKQIMDMIREYIIYTGIRIQSDAWNSYDEMNQLIMNTMDEEG